MKERTFFEANDGTLFQSAEQCRLYDTVQSAEIRKRALDKTEHNVKALQFRIDILKGRQYSVGMRTWAGRFDFTRGIDKNSKQALREKIDIEASWKTVANFASQWGYSGAPESASFNEIFKCLDEKFQNLRAVYYIYRYVKKRLAEVNRSDLFMTAYYTMYTAAAKALMVKRREELVEARKKLRTEKKKFARLAAANVEALRAESVRVTEQQL